MVVMSKYISLAMAALVSTVVFASTAMAQAADVPPAPGFGEMMMRMFPMFFLLFFIFYFMVIRPQNKKLRDHEAFMNSLKKGQNVVTTGGIIGRVAGIEKDYILLEISSNAKVKVERAHILKKPEIKDSKSADRGSK